MKSFLCCNPNKNKKRSNQWGYPVLAEAASRNSDLLSIVSTPRCKRPSRQFVKETTYSMPFISLHAIYIPKHRAQYNTLVSLPSFPTDLKDKVT